ncbi:glycosyltransferase family 2 protein [Pseudomonadota bacterium]
MDRAEGLFVEWVGLMESGKRISVVIPVFNSELSLENLCDQLGAELPNIAEEYEIILVDDGSKDNSWEVVSRLAEADQRICGIRLSRNYGQHNALLCGIRAAKFDVVVTMDDDLQNPVSEISKLLDRLNEGFDVVYGTPEKQQHGLFRNLASSLTKLALQNVMGAEIAKKVSAFRAFRTRLRCGFENYSSPYVSIDVLLTWSTSNFTTVTIAHAPRVLGQSNYTIWKLVGHAITLVTGFSIFPLRLASFIGFLFTFIGAAILAWVVGRYLIYGTSVPGFAFLASIIALFSGVQLFVIGVFGEYLARIHFRSMTKPSYVIAEENVGREG